MVEEPVGADRLAAGRLYLEALEGLGFVPDGAMWSVSPGNLGIVELSLFSSFVDRIGTGRMYEGLFGAYDRARTPREIDPWLVGLYSPRQAFFHAVEGYDFDNVRPGTDIAFPFGDEYGSEVVLMVRPEWVYRPLVRRAASALEIRRRWRYFERAALLAA